MIDNDTYAFDKLSEAKSHCDIAYTQKERIKYLNNAQIHHVINGEIVTTVDIRVLENGKLSFGKPIKVLSIRNH